MTTTTHTPHRTLGETSAAYATELVVAQLLAGAPGTVRRLTHPTGSVEAAAGPHARWSFTRTHLCNTVVDTYCVPTSTGIVLMVTTPAGDLRCLPTWGLPATDFGTAVLHLARALTTNQADPDPVDTECPGCTAEPGQPCRPWCLSWVAADADSDDPDTTDRTTTVPVSEPHHPVCLVHQIHGTCPLDH